MIIATELVSLETMKNHLRVDHDDEDSLISLYADAALAWCFWYCDSDSMKNETDASKIPAQVRSAMLLVLGDLFMRREASPVENSYTNPTVENLLWSCRDWRNMTEDKEPEGGDYVHVGG